CPVDCCVPDPANPETEAVLLARARELHPDESIAADAPSRFRKADGAPAAPAAAIAPKPAASAPAPSKPAPAVVAIAPPQAGLSEEFNPIAWEVPVGCKDCNETFSIPYRHFQAGVVFYCPSCSGSYVPNSTMARVVRETFEKFYARRRAEQDAIERRHARERELFATRQALEMAEFKQRVAELGREMKPAGKLVRPKGISAMFT
ncbi:MAG TPA: hypothetical protein VNF29_14410, partial [Candidatus Binataceae bacterium]|nr:hypothetical protein [Candidatus Binataceae bacterium]